MIAFPLMIGIIGSTLLLIAWFYETVESVREHRSLVDLRFAFVYVTANAFLLSYSFMIGDIIFLTLQSILICLVSSEIVYAIHVKKVHKKGQLRD